MNACEQEDEERGGAKQPEMSGLPGNGINWRVERGRKVKGGFSGQTVSYTGPLFCRGESSGHTKLEEEEEGKTLGGP